MFQGHLVQQLSEMQTLPSESRRTITFCFLHKAVFPLKGWVSLLGAKWLCADVPGGRLWENMWPRSVYTGTPASRLPNSIAGISSHLTLPKELAQIFSIWGPSSGWVDFCPIDIAEGGRWKVYTTTKMWAKILGLRMKLFTLFLECSGHYFSSLVVMGEPNSCYHTLNK